MSRKIRRTSILLLILFSPWMVWRIWLLHDVARELWKIRRAGLPTNARELDKWYSTPPANENAALLITKACPLCELSKPVGLAKRDWPPKRAVRLSSEDVSVLKSQLERDSTALSIVNSAVSLPHSRYPIELTNAFNTLLPHLAYLRRFALLYQSAALVAAQDNNGDLAATNICKILLVARTVEREPLLISQLVSLKLLHIAVETLERSLNLMQFGEPQLAELSRAFDEVPSALARIPVAFTGERAVMLTYFHASAEERRKLFTANPDDPIASRTFPNNPSSLLRIAGFYDLDEQMFLGAMEEAIEDGASSPFRTMSRLVKTGEKAANHWYFSSMTLSTEGPAILRFLDSQADINLGRTALQIERFRAAEGRLPEDLNELSTNRFELILFADDPFHRGTLRFKVSGKGYVVYSVGRDREDNGGREAPQNKQSVSPGNYDIVFKVE